MMTYGNNALGASPQWSDSSTAVFMVASGLCVVFIMLPPVFHTARKIRKHEDDAMYTIPSNSTIINARQSFMGSEKYLSPLPSAPPRTSAYGAIEEIDRVRSFREGGKQSMVMSSLADSKPKTAKRSSNGVDRVRAPSNSITPGHTNKTLQLDEEDVVWGNSYPYQR